MGCADCFSKIILYIINVVFILGGIAILGVGIWLKVDKDALALLDKAPKPIQDIFAQLSTGAIILIVFGACVFVIAVIGCCGVMQESACLLGIYIAFISIVIVVELAAGIFIYVQRNTIADAVKEPFNNYLQTEFYMETDATSNDTDFSYIFLMQTLKCCGVEDPSDLNINQKIPRTTAGTPFVCCKSADWETKRKDFTPESVAKCDAGDSEYRFQDGCYKAFLNFFAKYTNAAIGVGAGVAALELLVLISASCYCHKVRKDD